MEKNLETCPVFDRNNLKFVYKSTDFIVKLENGTVECNIKGELRSKWPFVNAVKRALKHNEFKPHKTLRRDGTLIADAAFHAMVKCSDVDTFNEEAGKKLAESKCKQSIHLKTVQIIGEICDETEQEIINFKRLGLKYLSNFAQECVHTHATDMQYNGDQE